MTIIDSLIIELGLDPSGFNREERELVSKLRKIQQQFEDTGKKSQHHTKGITEGFNQLQSKILSVTALFLGGMGLKQFFEHVVVGTAKLGVMSDQLNVNYKDLFAWGKLVEQVNGSADEAATSFRAITGELEAFKMNAGNSRLPAVLGSMISPGRPHGIPAFDAQGKPRQPTDLIMEMARWAQTVPKPAAAARLREAQLSEHMIDAILEFGPEEIERRLAKIRHDLAPSVDEVNRAREAQILYNEALQAVEAPLRRMATGILPKISAVLNSIVDLVENPKNESLWERVKRFEEATSTGLAQGPGVFSGQAPGGAPAPPSTGRPMLQQRPGWFTRGGQTFPVPPERPTDGGSLPPQGAAPTGGGGGGGGDPLQGRANVVMDELMKQGLSKNQAAALAGHFSYESDFAGKTNPGEGAAGLMHWRQDRLARLQSYLGSQNLKIDTSEASLRAQARFWVNEARNDPYEKTRAKRFLDNPNADVGALAAELRKNIRYGTPWTTPERARRAFNYFKNFMAPGAANAATAPEGPASFNERFGFPGGGDPQNQLSVGAQVRNWPGSGTPLPFMLADPSKRLFGTGAAGAQTTNSWSIGAINFGRVRDSDRIAEDFRALEQHKLYGWQGNDGTK